MVDIGGDPLESEHDVRKAQIVLQLDPYQQPTRAQPENELKNVVLREPGLILGKDYIRGLYAVEDELEDGSRDWLGIFVAVSRSRQPTVSRLRVVKPKAGCEAGEFGFGMVAEGIGLHPWAVVTACSILRAGPMACEYSRPRCCIEATMQGLEGTVERYR
jgi:hypothetical protein